MGVISTYLTAQRTALAAAPASLNNVPASMDINGMAASNRHQAFTLKVAGVPTLLKMHGGGVVEYEQDLDLEIRWDPELDPEAIHNTVADDLENASHVMLKASNRTGTEADGVLLVLPSGGAVTNETDQISAVLTYTVTYRVTQDMT